MDTKYPWRLFVNDGTRWRTFGIYSDRAKAESAYRRQEPNYVAVQLQHNDEDIAYVEYEES